MKKCHTLTSLKPLSWPCLVSILNLFENQVWFDDLWRLKASARQLVFKHCFLKKWGCPWSRIQSKSLWREKKINYKSVCIAGSSNDPVSIRWRAETYHGLTESRRKVLEAAEDQRLQTGSFLPRCHEHRAH